MIDEFPNVKSNYSYFPVFVNENEYGMSRDVLYEKLKSHNIYGRRYFYPLISTFTPYKDLDSAEQKNLPIAKKLADSVICLPVYADLKTEDLERITGLIIKK